MSITIKDIAKNLNDRDRIRFALVKSESELEIYFDNGLEAHCSLYKGFFNFDIIKRCDKCGHEQLLTCSYEYDLSDDGEDDLDTVYSGLIKAIDVDSSTIVW